MYLVLFFCNLNEDDHHNSDIDAHYTSICDALLVASRKHIPSSNVRCSQDNVVPGFNEHLKDLHDKAMQYYVIWRDAGTSRNDATQSDMRVSQLQFKYALRTDVVMRMRICMGQMLWPNR